MSRLIEEIASATRPIAVDAENVEILGDPRGFYESIRKGLADAKSRVVFVALYLGLHEGKEVEFLEGLKQAVLNPRNHAKFQIVVDAQRSMRPVRCKDGGRPDLGSKSSVDVLVDQIMSSGRGNLSLSLFHSPLLRGILNRTLPPRVREIVGVQHMKIYIFDDTLILSGANISDSYLTNRQDRIILFRKNKHLANRFHEIANCIASNSFKVVQAKEDASRRCILPSAIFPGKFSSSYLLDPPRFDPLTQPFQFSLNLRNQLEEIFVPSSADKSTLIYRRSFPKRFLAQQTYFNRRSNAMVVDDKSNRSIDWDMGDTWLLPTVQAGFAGVRQEEAFTLSILNLIGDQDGDLWITSPYMNFSESYVRAMAHLPKEICMTILTSSMEANGFFGSKGLSGQIPLAYAMLEQRFWSRISKNGEQRTLREYSREGHEFHAKGLYWMPQKTDEPMLASLGSSNFGIRSLRRDLECQSILITKNKALRNKLKDEWKGLIHHSSVINQENLLQKGSYFGRLAIRAVRGFL
eukprot:jgi/Picsp_1/6019/NSC_03373-R1_phosphatidylglycerophosphate synthase 1